MPEEQRRSNRRTRVDGERTKSLILETAVRLATIEGLDGLSIGKLASATEVSKSGVYAHFDSKEDLQLATIDAARELFIDVVVTPALKVRGIDRLRSLCESFLSYVEQRTLPGGCFFAAAAAELGARPGPLKQRVAENQRDWMRLLTEAADEAERGGELRAGTEVAVLTFELNALVVAANTSFILHDDPTVIERARTAVGRALAAATPGGGPLGGAVHLLMPTPPPTATMASMDPHAPGVPPVGRASTFDPWNLSSSISGSATTSWTRRALCSTRGTWPGSTRHSARTCSTGDSTSK